MNDITQNNSFESNIQIFSEVFIGHINTHYNNDPNNTVEIYDQCILNKLETFSESEIKEIAIKKAEAYIYFWAVHEEIRKIYTLSREENEKLIELWQNRRNLEAVNQIRSSSINSIQSEVRKEKLKTKVKLIQTLEGEIQEFNSLLQRTILSEEHRKLLDDTFHQTSGIYLVSKGLIGFLEDFNNPEGVKPTIENTLNKAGILLNEDIKVSSGWFDVSTPYGEVVQPLKIQ